MKPINIGGHSAYQDRVLTQLRKYYPNPRLFNTPPRGSEEWKLEYNARTSAERCNKREKIDYKLEDGRYRSSMMWYCRLFAIMMCQHLDAWTLPKTSRLKDFFEQTA